MPEREEERGNAVMLLERRTRAGSSILTVVKAGSLGEVLGEELSRIFIRLYADAPKMRFIPLTSSVLGVVEQCY